MSSLPRVPLDALTGLVSTEELRAAVARPAAAPVPRPRRLPHNKRREAAGTAGPGLDPAVWEKIKDHPCYSEEAHHDFARMHVAVAPACNIQCHYCNRKYDCANESRPGVVSQRLTPEQAVRRVLAVAAEVPQLSVVGVAGPGDALSDARRTLATFERLRAEMPELTLCVSTNGLALPDHVTALKALDVDHITITINFLDPAVGAAIHPWIFHGHRRWTGLEAARILHERQMEGLEMAVAAGMLVKVNSVLIPGINDDHLAAVNQRVRAMGAFLHNVMPLISDPVHGTHFGLSGQRGPTPAEVHRAREALGEDAKLMRHCRQCRADAVGMLGEDRCQTLAVAEPDPTAPLPRPDPEARAAYRAVVESARAERAAAAAQANTVAQAVTPVTEAPRLVAVCSRGGGRVNLHFGKATEFHVYQVDGTGIRFSGMRRADNYCLGGYGDAERLDTILAVLEGVSAVVCVKIGDGPRRRLEAAGLTVHEDGRHEVIETVLADWLAETAAVAAMPARA